MEGAGRPSERSKVHLLRTCTKNASGEEMLVSVETFNGHRILNLRIWYRGEDGEMRHGKQGLTL